MQAGLEREQVLVGDIGGTNGRFGIAVFDRDGIPHIEELRTYPSADYSSLTGMVANYLEDVGAAGYAAKPDAVRLAIAGPTSARTGRLTNLPLVADAADIEKELGLRDVMFLNDFGALAYAATVLQGPDVMQVKDGTKIDGAAISVMGPGTGFGVALLVQGGQGWTVIPTEGGHMTFSPVSPLEEDLCRHLRKSNEHVSVETLVCGEGLARIHRFLVEYGGSGDVNLRPAEISAAAQAGTDPSCERAVQLFLSILGSVAGDIALVHGARGGVYFGGGILPKISSLLDKSDLKDRFVSKGPMRPYLKSIPIHMITTDHAALMGAAIAP